MELVGGGLVIVLLLGLLIPLLVALFVFAVLYIAKHKKLEEFFNKRAGMTIVPSRIIGGSEYIAVALGAVVGVLQWFEALSGGLFMGVVNTVALCAGALYLYKRYKQLRGALTPAALKWLLVYKGCTLYMFFVGGELLSVVAIFLLVGSMFLTGANYLWKDTFSYGNPTKSGEGSIRTCKSCQYWDNNYCSFHGMEMPPHGGCGKND